MSRRIKVKCPNYMCNWMNDFVEDELIGEVPQVDKAGARVPPPPVKVDENTFVKCEKCGYPICCADATISNQDDRA